MNRKKLKIAIIAMIIVLFILMILIIYFINVRNKDINIPKKTDSNVLNNTISNTSTEDKTEDNLYQNNKKNLDITPLIDSSKTSLIITDEDLRLKQVIDNYSYFLCKQCLNTFYLKKESAYNVLAEDLRQYNISNFYGQIEDPSICIDKIYKAEGNLDLKIYVIYYRIELGNGLYGNLFNVIKIDKKNRLFAIYPYEYLISKNVTGFNENDIISRDIISLDEVTKTEYNHYRIDDINTSESVCIREIFERCSFDYQFDKNHLFTVLNENYRNTRFQNIDEFINYLNTTNVLKGNIKDYQSEKVNEGIQYILRGSYNNYYVVNYNNIMNYNLILDEYTILSQKYLEVYNSSFPTVQAKSCIDRVRRAIDDKNYRFIYEKYNITQKNKDFQNYTDFVNFIKQSFYEQNTFEYLDFENITNSIYKYQVKITDASEKVLSYRKVFMTVTLKDNADFEINITK